MDYLRQTKKLKKNDITIVYEEFETLSLLRQTILLDVNVIKSSL